MNAPMRKVISAITLLLAFAGCANPGIVQISPDTYMLSRADRAGIFGNAAALKASVIRDANEFAISKGKVAIPLTARETPIAPGRFAVFEYQFRVLDKADPEAQRVALRPRADVVIEKTERISADIETKDATAVKRDLYTELTKLDDLRKRGILSEVEFAAQKKKLLDSQ